jgi:hypothetical protein
MARSPLFDIYDPYSLLTQQAQYGLPPEEDEFAPIGMIPVGKRKPQLSDLMPKEEQSGLLNTLANVGASGLSGFGWLIDTPASMARGLLSGGPGKAISALWESSDDRVTGRELLRQYGLVGEEDTWNNFGAGVVAETLLDPFFYATLGLSSLGKGAASQAGKAMASSGLLRDAALDSVTRVNQLRQARGLAQYADDIPTPRVREYNRLITPRESLAMIPDRAARREARGRLFDQFRRYGVGPEGLDSPAAVLDNVRIPGTNIGFEVDGGWLGDSIARGLDRAGDWTKRAPVIGQATRTAAALFDPAVGDLGTVAGDLDLTNELQLAKRFASRQARDNLEQVNDLYSRLQYDGLRAQVPDTIPSGPLAGQAIPEELRSFDSQGLWNSLGDYVEGPTFAGPTPSGAAGYKTSGNEVADWVMENVPEFRAIRDRFVQMGPGAIAAARQAGLPTPVARSRGVDGFIPRQLRFWRSPQDPDIPGGVPRREKPWARDERAFGVADNFGRSRDEAYDLPGGMRAFRYLTGNADTSLIDSAALQQALINADDPGAQRIIDLAMDTLASADPTSFQRGASARPYQYLVDQLSNSSAYTNATPARQQRMMDRLTRRIDGNYKRLANLLRTADTQFAENSVGIFDTPSWNNVVRYETGQAVNRANADVLFDMMQRHADDTPAGAVTGGTNLPLEEAAERLGFDRRNFRQRWQAETGYDPTDYSINSRMLESLRTLAPKSQLAPPERGVLGVVDNFTNAFKVGALASPAFHVRNLYSGAINSMTQGAFNPLDFFAAFRASQGAPEAVGRRLRNTPGYNLPGMTDADRAREFLAQTGAQRVATGNVLSDITTNPAMANSGDAAAVRGMFTGSSNEPTVRDAAAELVTGRAGRSWTEFLNDFFSMRGVGITQEAPARNTNPLLVLNDAVGQSVEDTLRTGTFLNQVRKGVDPRVAGDITRLLQLDYSPQAFTSFERNWAKRVFPFYSFQKQILGSIGDNMLYRPGGLQSQAVRTVNRASEPSEDNFVPEYLRQSAAIPLPPELGGQPSENLQRYVTNLDLPWESTLQLLTPGIGGSSAAAFADMIAKTGSNILGQSNPLLKAPLEYVTNRQLYSGRDLSDLYSVLEQDLGPIGRPIEQALVNFLPFGARGLGLYRQLTDDRLPADEAAMKAAFNLLAGVKITDVDKDRTKRMAARDVLNQILETTPGVRTYENITVPEEALQQMPEEQRRMYLLYKIIQSEAAKRARDKKKQETAIDPLELLGAVR